jgi:putative transposase
VTRPELKARHPLHLTWRFASDLPNLRAPQFVAILREAFDRGRDRFGFRLVQFTIQSNHLHLIAEAEDERALSRGMQGLGVRIAKALNKWLGRAGRVLGDRYHARQLRTPREVRNALRYVLNNALRHGVRCALPDPCSSGASFDGWSAFDGPLPVTRRAPICRARSWLLRIGWRRGGLIALSEVPGGVS